MREIDEEAICRNVVSFCLSICLLGFLFLFLFFQNVSNSGKQLELLPATLRNDGYDYNYDYGHRKIVKTLIQRS